MKSKGFGLFLLGCFLVSFYGCQCGKQDSIEAISEKKKEAILIDILVENNPKDSGIQEALHEQTLERQDAKEKILEQSPQENKVEESPKTSDEIQEWIGSRCQSSVECPYTDSICLTPKDGYDGGMCSSECSKLCPDKNGKPGTFCIATQGALPQKGICTQRCAYGNYPQSGCREGYSCKLQTRESDPDSQAFVCLPKGVSAPSPSGNYAQLIESGLDITLQPDPKDIPAGVSGNAICTVQEAILLAPDIHGVEWVTGNNKKSWMFVRAELALAISQLSKYLKSIGVTKVMHFGTYNCRAIRTDNGSTDTISQHGLGRAVDIGALYKDGVEYSLVKHWDHSTKWKNDKNQTGCWSTQFNSMEAKFLYEVACQMWKQKMFSLVLTPNYNNAHDDHFHVDLSSNGTIFATFPPFIGTHSGH